MIISRLLERKSETRFGIDSTVYIRMEFVEMKPVASC